VNREEIARRVPIVAAELLAEKGYIAAVDVIMRLGWLTPEAHESWRFGRVPYLEQVVTGNLSRLGFTMGELRNFAQQVGLRPSWTGYVTWGKKGRSPLRFTRSGLPELEQAYATHWLKPKA
jgi:hypothetical protein